MCFVCISFYIDGGSFLECCISSDTGIWLGLCICKTILRIFRDTIPRSPGTEDACDFWRNSDRWCKKHHSWRKFVSYRKSNSSTIQSLNWEQFVVVVREVIFRYNKTWLSFCFHHILGPMLILTLVQNNNVKDTMINRKNIPGQSLERKYKIQAIP